MIKMKITDEPIETVEIEVKLDFLKGSLNRMMIIKNNTKRLIYSGNYRQQKEKVKKYLEENYNNLKGYLINHPEFYFTVVEYIVFDKWLTKISKYQKLRKKDVQNFIKNAEDVIFPFLGIEDETIVKLKVEKGLIIDNKDPVLKCNIKIYKMDTKTFKIL
jgi:hypothetical protein